MQNVPKSGTFCITAITIQLLLVNEISRNIVIWRWTPAVPWAKFSNPIIYNQNDNP